MTTTFEQAIMSTLPAMNFEPVSLKAHSGAVRRRIIASRPDLVALEPVNDPNNRIVKARLTGEHGDGDYVVICSRVGARRSLQVMCGTLPVGMADELNCLQMIGDPMTADERARLDDGAQFTLPGGQNVVNVAA